MLGKNLVATARRVSRATGFALCQCRLRDVDNRFSAGRASGTQNETDNLFLYKSLVAFRFREKILFAERTTTIHEPRFGRVLGAASIWFENEFRMRIDDWPNP